MEEPIQEKRDEERGTRGGKKLEKNNPRLSTPYERLQFHSMKYRLWHYWFKFFKWWSRQSHQCNHSYADLFKYNRVILLFTRHSISWTSSLSVRSSKRGILLLGTSPQRRVRWKMCFQIYRNPQLDDYQLVSWSWFRTPMEPITEHWH